MTNPAAAPPPSRALPRPVYRQGRTSRALPAAEGQDGILVGLAGLGGTWVTITLRDAAGADRNTSFVMSLASGDPPKPGAPLQEEALGAGVFSWTGRLPPDVSGLRIAPLLVTEPPALTAIEIRRRGRLPLVLRGLARDPRLTLRVISWRLQGKKVRSRHFLGLAVMPRPEADYGAWRRRYARLSRAEIGRIGQEIGGWTSPPLISVLMPVYNTPATVLEAAIRSVRDQLYPHWELCIADDASSDPAVTAFLSRLAAKDERIRVVRRTENGHIARATNDALALAKGRYAAFLDHDDVLPRHALYEVARAIVADPNLILIYSDEDKIDAEGALFEPHFKTDFDRELLYCQNYLNHLTVVRMSELRALGGLRPGFEGSQDHDLMLRLTRDLDRERIRHIPKVLYHWRAGDGSGTFSDRALAQTEGARLRAVEEITAPMGARVERGPLGYNRVHWPLPDPPPRVSVVIPTRDGAELLRVALDGLFGATAYPDIEIVVVDNDSRQAETTSLLARYRGDRRFRVIEAPGPFNFSDLSNRGAAASSGSVLLFLNNDVEVIEPDWLRELVTLAVRPEIGAVGAKLLYPDGTLQHGGVVLRIGSVAGHAQLGLEAGEPGYFGRMQQTREVSAVTAACLAIRRSVFEEVGGFDAEALKIAYNDVDLCLKLRRAGYRNLWTPFARLIHHESKSRGPEDSPEKAARLRQEAVVMQTRWGSELASDPYYSPNFVPNSTNFQF